MFACSSSWLSVSISPMVWDITFCIFFAPVSGVVMFWCVLSIFLFVSSLPRSFINFNFFAHQSQVFHELVERCDPVPGLSRHNKLRKEFGSFIWRFKISQTPSEKTYLPLTHVYDMKINLFPKGHSKYIRLPLYRQYEKSKICFLNETGCYSWLYGSIIYKKWLLMRTC